MSQPEKDPSSPGNAGEGDHAQIIKPEQSLTPPSTGEKGQLDEHSAATSSTAVPADREQRPGSSSSNNALSVNEVDALLAHLPEEEKQILKTQLDEQKVNISYFGLWRYATRMDLFILVVSFLCAIAAGAALPLFTVCITSSVSIELATNHA
jgi:ATP-binding cassette subfamily B (MDR/TAP) protein 1